MSRFQGTRGAWAAHWVASRGGWGVTDAAAAGGRCSLTRRRRCPRGCPGGTARPSPCSQSGRAAASPWKQTRPQATAQHATRDSRKHSTRRKHHWPFWKPQNISGGNASYTPGRHGFNPEVGRTVNTWNSLRFPICNLGLSGLSHWAAARPKGVDALAEPQLQCRSARAGGRHRRRVVPGAGG